MRRLAKQDRSDRVRSNRDYQTISSGCAKLLLLRQTSSLPQLIFKSMNTFPTDLCIGMYLKPSQDTDIEVIVSSDNNSLKLKYHLSKTWNRLGIHIKYSFTPSVKIIVSFKSNLESIALWGEVVGDSTTFKELLGLKEDLPKEFSMSHLAPESFFLIHENPNLELDIKNSDIQDIKDLEIYLKKCAYCQRLLPVDPEKVLQLGFHKHKAKISGHQNECRACKKFRINDFFNPKRTSDQLHESSVITRERKILLQEPFILQKFKDRNTGEGLRSYIWHRFNKQCFKCHAAVQLKEYELDHTRPLSYLWPIDEHATCLCSQCNNYKKDRFPVDFYSESELSALPTIIELPLSELKKKSVNQEQLNRLKINLLTFVSEYDPRTFRSIANRVLEINPDDNLFKLLKTLDEAAYQKLLHELSLRPSNTEDDVD